MFSRKLEVKTMQNVRFSIIQLLWNSWIVEARLGRAENQENPQSFVHQKSRCWAPSPLSKGAVRRFRFDWQISFLMARVGLHADGADWFFASLATPIL